MRTIFILKHEEFALCQLPIKIWRRFSKYSYSMLLHLFGSTDLTI